jgi:hypothetical protein
MVHVGRMLIDAILAVAIKLFQMIRIYNQCYKDYEAIETF